MGNNPELLITVITSQYVSTRCSISPGRGLQCLKLIFQQRCSTAALSRPEGGAQSNGPSQGELCLGGAKDHGTVKIMDKMLWKEGKKDGKLMGTDGKLMKNDGKLMENDRTTMEHERTIMKKYENMMGRD